MERHLAAIFAADAVGYSRLIRADEEGTLTAFKALQANLIDPKLSEHHGRTVKLMGDGILVEFASVVGAVRAAAEIQKGLAERNAVLPHDKRIEFRAGINLGDVVIDGDDIHGDGVNVATRLEGLATPGGICISEAVYEQVRDRISLRFEDQGLKEVKNIDRPLRVWHWHPDQEAAVEVTAPAEMPPPDRPSIAVLPFDNMSGDQEQEYFADGITEDIITEISKIHGLVVISRNSTFTYKKKAVKAQDVCRDLGVRYILEGSVRKAGERVRITAQLIDGRSGGHLWAERYDRGLADIFAVQDDVTERIVRSLEVKLVKGDDACAPRIETDNPEAYDCVLRGREQYRLFSKNGNAAARRLYERAIELDPNYAAAHAALAETYLHDWFAGATEALDRAFDLALKAKELEPSIPLVYEALGSVHLFKRQHDQALVAARRWVEVEPGNAEAYANLAGILNFAGEPEQVAGLIEKAKRLNPFYPFYYTLYLGQAHLTMHRFREAAAFIKRSVTHNPQHLPSHFYLAATYGQLGETALARDALAEVLRISPDFSIAWVRTIAAYRRTDDLNLLLDGLRKAGLRE
ncbi:tetratricopeptide repeat protein [Mesorhizobium sp. L-8-3]|uniref:tetratricopeptide repeat protein n=1 Tax=Mesorhizobium sp. L-8-3 TaxID=2744522 RepID=UPI001925F98A|nr:tetratricopeptide repeat protein [Mesorhizobium sp. L-8-3]BCH27202.1 guanylyl cyclase [Mesorhizobium sp. L-8-3]